jgi:hypothetical protein
MTYKEFLELRGITPSVAADGRRRRGRPLKVQDSAPDDEAKDTDPKTGEGTGQDQADASAPDDETKKKKRGVFG